MPDTIRKSLYEDFEAFVRSSVVYDYFYLLEHLMSELMRFYETFVKTSPEVNSILNAICTKTISEELGTNLNKLERLMSKQLTQNDVSDCMKKLLSQEWHKNIKAFLQKYAKKPFKLDRLTLLQDVFGFNLTTALATEVQWKNACIESLGQADFYHQQIATRIERNAKALAHHYKPIHNVVTFDALVMLTIWAYAHDDYSFDDDSHERILAYGNFEHDYTIFKALANTHTSIHIAYIDFGLPRTTDLILLYIKPEKESHSFGVVFREGNLELSMMRTSGSISDNHGNLLKDVVSHDAPEMRMLVVQKEEEEEYESDDY